MRVLQGNSRLQAGLEGRQAVVLLQRCIIGPGDWEQLSVYDWRRCLVHWRDESSTKWMSSNPAHGKPGLGKLSL